MTELIDTSALILGVRDPRARAWMAEALANDDLAICDVVALEYLMGARNAHDYARLEAALGGFASIPTMPVDWARARDVHRRLAAAGAGHQRSVRIPDLVIAAVAERAGVGIVHYDEDYDRIAAVTGQPVRWILPRGEVFTRP